MGKINVVWSYLARHKYLITITIGILIIGVTDENSLRKYFIYQMKIAELQAELTQLEEDFERDSLRLNALKVNAKGVERIARERYFMKRPNEEVFVLSTDKREDN